jgi:hypothetical protein
MSSVLMSFVIELDSSLISLQSFTQSSESLLNISILVVGLVSLTNQNNPLSISQRLERESEKYTEKNFSLHDTLKQQLSQSRDDISRDHLDIW